MKDIPLPNELPTPVNLGQVPDQVLHSNAVESLLQQNQDLTTRLSIQIRRTVDFENSISEKDGRIKVLTSQKEILSQEYELISEKYRQLSVNYSKIKAEREQIEKRFAEFYSEQNSSQDRLQEENILLRQVIRRYQKYRFRVRQLLRPAFKRKNELEKITTSQKLALDTMKTELARHQRYRFKILTRVRPWTKILQSKMNDLTYRSFTLDKKISDLNQHLLVLNQKLIDQRAQFEKDQTRLVDYHEARFNQSQDLLEQRHGELQMQIRRATLAEKSLEALREKQAELENRTIQAERSAKDLENKKLSEASQIEEKNARLQSLLERAVQEIEDVKVRETAAQKLNRRLSEDMAALRKESEQLRLRLRSAQNEAQKEMAAMAQSQAAPEQPRQTILLNRIEKILAEIQTGHSHIDFVPERNEKTQNAEKIAPSIPEAPTAGPGTLLLTERGDLEDLV